MPSNLRETQAQLDLLNAQLKEVENEIEDAKSALTTYMILLNKMNIPYGGDAIVRYGVRVKMTVDMLIRGFNLLDIASGPWGWAKAIGTFAVAGASGYSLFEAAMGV